MIDKFTKPTKAGFTPSLEGRVPPRGSPAFTATPRVLASFRNFFSSPRRSKTTTRPFSAGFTLIEMLVAVLLLITAVAGPLTIASKGITTSVVAKDQITAFFLAQDAVEYIRHKRDTNRLAGNSWLAGLEGCISADGNLRCHVDSTENSPQVPFSCSATIETGCSIIRYDNSLNRFTNSGGTLSPINMRRFVSIKTPINGNSDEAELVVRMTWFSAQNTTILREIVVRENLLNWQ